MPGNTPDAPSPTENSSDGDHPEERYSAFRIADGDLVIYDTENTRAWLQSSATVDVAGIA